MGELTAAVAFCVATSWWMSRWFSCSSARRLSLSTGPPITALSCLFLWPSVQQMNIKSAPGSLWHWEEVTVWNMRLVKPRHPASKPCCVCWWWSRFRKEQRLLHLFVRVLSEFHLSNVQNSGFKSDRQHKIIRPTHFFLITYTEEPRHVFLEK